MTKLEEQYISALHNIAVQREQTLDDFQEDLLDGFRNIVAKYSREYCHLVDQDVLISTAQNVITEEIAKLSKLNV